MKSAFVLCVSYLKSYRSVARCLGAALFVAYICAHVVPAISAPTPVSRDTVLTFTTPSKLITAQLANTIAKLLAQGNVTLIVQSGADRPHGNLILGANVSLQWNSPYSLTLSAFNDISFDDYSTIRSNGSGSLILRADRQGNGRGNVSFGTGSAVDFSASTGTVSIFYNPTSYPDPADYSQNVVVNNAVTQQLTAYMLINDARHLQNVADDLTGDYALGKTIDATETSRWNGGRGFIPLGTKQPFTGILDGQGAGINNLFIDSAGNEVGLIGTLGSGGVVRNVGLTDVDITVTYPYGNGNTGTLVAISSGTITGASSSGRISSTTSNIGGLVGSIDNGTIADSSAVVAVTSATSANVGGLVGYATGGSISGSSARGNVTSGASSWVGGLVARDTAATSISQSYATGAVNGDRGAGGLIADNEGTVAQSFATGQVTGGTISPFGDALVGGLAGYNGKTITQSFATGPVMTGNTPYAVDGGLVGWNEFATVTQSYSTGTVVAKGASALVGGLIGANEFAASATNSYWDTQSSGVPTSPVGTGLTTAHLQSGALPAGFDPTVWSAVAGRYPFLDWYR